MPISQTEGNYCEMEGICSTERFVKEARKSDSLIFRNLLEFEHTLSL